MLVLTRKIGEHITIGEDAVVIIQSVTGKKVRLAIEASPRTKILRGELNPFDGLRSVIETREQRARPLGSAGGGIHG